MAFSLHHPCPLPISLPLPPQQQRHPLFPAPRLCKPCASLSPYAGSEPPRAVIVGAGLAGLSAAVHLSALSVPFLLLDASDAVGGRVRTDVVDGFLLDRGFQIFLTAYPFSSSLLDLSSLRLRPFYPGSYIFHSGQLHLLSDPFRRPLRSLPALASPIGSLPDKLLTAITRIRAAAVPDDLIFSSPETTIADRLRSIGFSDSIVDRFFRPFFAGIFFDNDLTTSSRLFDFVFKCLALGDNALPAAGIGSISLQLASRLPPDSIRLNARVASLDSRSVTLAGGAALDADLGVIVAVDQPEAARLLPSAGIKPGRKRSTVCIYYSAERAAIRDPVLVLNGSGKGIVNNMFFASNVAPEYAPEGKVLVSVSLVGDFEDRSDDEALAEEVITELAGWFGADEVKGWRHLRTYRIGFAQPDQTPPTSPTGRDPRVSKGVYLCGDHWTSATFEGALISGRTAAEALARDRQLSLA